MVYKVGLSTVINNEAAYIHESFPQISVGSTENVKITASEPSYIANFGKSVAVGSRIVVGAPHKVHGGIPDAGSAYIFDLDGNQLGIITAFDASSYDYFGYSVAVGSGRIVVGAYGDGSFYEAGSAYIFDLDGNQLEKIPAPNPTANDRFGTSVAVGSGRIVVGAPYEAHGGFAEAGSAYIFDLDGNQLGIITASDPGDYDHFGTPVAVGSGRIVVGAVDDNHSGIINAGSVYIFDLDGNQLGIITASDPAADDYFGYSVAVGSGRIVVGAVAKDSGGIINAGSVYIFDLDGNQLGIITTSDPADYDYFGTSVAVGSGRIVVGSPYEVHGGFDEAGSAYIFDLDGNQLGIITASDPAANDLFGMRVAVGSGRIVVGAKFDDDNGLNSGSAYIYNLPEDSNTYWERILETYKY